MNLDLRTLKANVNWENRVCNYPRICSALGAVQRHLTPEDYATSGVSVKPKRIKWKEKRTAKHLRSLVSLAVATVKLNVIWNTFTKFNIEEVLATKKNVDTLMVFSQVVNEWI